MIPFAAEDAPSGPSAAEEQQQRQQQAEERSCRRLRALASWVYNKGCVQENEDDAAFVVEKSASAPGVPSEVCCGKAGLCETVQFRQTYAYVQLMQETRGQCSGTPGETTPEFDVIANVYAFLRSWLPAFPVARTQIRRDLDYLGVRRFKVGPNSWAYDLPDSFHRAERLTSAEK